MFDVLKAQRKGDRLMKKTSTVQALKSKLFKEQKLTIGLDLGDCWSFYCVLDEAGQIILEQKLPTTPEAMKQTFGKIPRSLIALETGTHSPWVSRVLTELGHEVIVAHAQKVQWITKRNRNAERARQGIRRTDGENRQGSVPGSVFAQAGEGRGNTDRSDVCPDDRGPVPVSEESPGRLFSGVTTWPQELWGERTTEGYQQRRRPVFAHDDGAGSALHSGAFWRRQRSATMGTKACGARRKKCQEASGGGRGSKASGPAASAVGRRRGVRTTAQ